MDVNHKVTLRDFAIKEWLPKRKAAKEEKTYELDESVTRLHLLPKFGDTVLRAIALKDVEAYLGEIRKAKGPWGARRAGTPVGRMRDIASRFAERISGVHIDAINIPEIRDEPRRSQDPRPFPYLAIKPPREYARMLAALTGKEPIINQVVVHYDRESYVTWLRETWDEYGIRSRVLVGGDSSRTAYEGPSVLEAAHPGRS